MKNNPTLDGVVDQSWVNMKQLIKRYKKKIM